jgi:hypothetical protein
MEGHSASPIADEARAPMVARLFAFAQSARRALGAYRGPIFAICAVLFCAGFWVSAGRLELAFGDLALRYIALSALVFIPVSMIYGALNFMVMARGAGITIPFGKSLKISCVAAFAEFLPIPGGALVRGGAMIREGSGAVDAGLHVTVNALLWISCSAVAACFALGIWQPVALAIGAGGVLGVAACSVWLIGRAGLGIALAALFMRVIGLGIAGARLIAAFLAIGVAIEFFDLYPFVFATILGSAASIAPGGLGISEIVAASIATLSTVPPEAAFLAVGLNRLIGFAVSGIATGIITLIKPADRGA